MSIFLYAGECRYGIYPDADSMVGHEETIGRGRMWDRISGAFSDDAGDRNGKNVGHKRKSDRPGDQIGL